MATPLSGSVTASQIGSYFVAQYYHVLRQQPDCAHQFYADSSTMIRVDGDSSTSASATLQIHAMIASLEMVTIEIKTINAVESWDGGIMVVVTGHVQLKIFGNNRRSFVETFFLAPQEKGFFVLNDIFHFLDHYDDEDDEDDEGDDDDADGDNNLFHHQQHTEPQDGVDPRDYSALPLIVPEHPVCDIGWEEDNSREHFKLSQAADEPVDKYSLPEQHGADESDPEPFQEREPDLDQIPPSPVAAHTVVDMIQNPWEEPVISAVTVALEDLSVAEPQKKTYASILLNSKAQSGGSVSVKRTSPASEWQPVAEAAPPAPPYMDSFSHVREVVEEETFVVEDEGESPSVYVRNLPSTVSVSDLEHEFRIFGPIKPDGVFIRNRKEIGVCYAFVEFEDASYVRNAIKGSPIQMGGRQVYVEERRQNGGGGRGSKGPHMASGRGGGGRGGRVSYHQKEAVQPRGRYGSARSTARGTGADGGGGDYLKAGRGNGFYQR